MRQSNGLATLILLLLTFHVNANHTDEYIQGHKDIAQREMQRSGIPASIILAQGIHESAWGRGELAVNSNNHFGIKCKDYWQGPKYYHKDDDYVNGKLIKSCFRAYENVESSYIDHTDFLLQTRYYQELFDYDETDYRNWAYGLKRCGYATDPAYAEKIISLIERYELYEYDQLSFMNIATVAPVEVMEAPTFYIPVSFTTVQNTQLVISDYPEAQEPEPSYTFNDVSSQEETYTIDNEYFDYEVTPPPTPEREVLSMSAPSATIIQTEHVRLQRTNYRPATGVIPNGTAKDRRLKNLSRKPRMSSGAGPR